MKYSGLFILSFLLVVAVSAPCFSQEDKTIRPSPPAEVSAMIGSAKVMINYSSPSVKGRQIWGALVPYNQVWRTGANEATIFETDKALTIDGKILPAGKYGLFTIPGEKEWIFIFNSVWNQWGAFKYDPKMDVIRVTGHPGASPVFNERMLFEIKNNQVLLSWEKLMVTLDVKG